MAQRLIGYNSDLSLGDLTDVEIASAIDFDVLVKLGAVWKNYNLNSAIISAFSLRKQVVNADFICQPNTIYIVNTKNGPVNGLLPAAPQIGDRLIFVDAKSNRTDNQNSCDVGWGTNGLTLIANLNSFIEGVPTAAYTTDRDCVHLIYNSCDNWSSMTPVVRLATEITPGIAEMATREEALDRTNVSKIINPLRLYERLEDYKAELLEDIYPLPSASETEAGVAKLATQALTNVGEDDLTIVTPKKLKANLEVFSPLNFTVRNNLTVTSQITTPLAYITRADINTLNVLSGMNFPFNVTFTATVDLSDATVVGLRRASEAIEGVSKVATQEGVNLGVDNSTFVSPLKLKTLLDTRFPIATETVIGIARIATQEEAITGYNDQAFITPLKLKVKLQEELENIYERLLALENIDSIIALDYYVQISSTVGSVITGNFLANGFGSNLSVHSIYYRSMSISIGVSTPVRYGNLIVLSNGEFQYVITANSLTSSFNAQAEASQDLVQLQYVVQNSKGQYKEAYLCLEVIKGINMPPEVFNPITNYSRVEGAPSDVFNLNNVFRDAESQPLNYSIQSISDSMAVNATLTGNILTISYPLWTTNVVTDRANRNVVVSIRAIDSTNQTNINTFMITVSRIANLGPTMITPLTDLNRTEGDSDDYFDLRNYFSDPESQPLTFSVLYNSNPTTVIASIVSGNDLRLQYPTWTGNLVTTPRVVNITVRAIDSIGNTREGEGTIYVSKYIAPNMSPVVINPMSDITDKIEGDLPTVINLNTVFEDPEGLPLTYSIDSNSHSSFVGTSISGSTLTLSYPLWSSDYNLNKVVTIQVRATEPTSGQYATDTITVNLASLESLFTDNYWRFDYLYELGQASIYVGDSERDSINTNYSATFEDKNTLSFKAIPYNAPIPSVAISTGLIIPVYRFREIGQPNYLYTGPIEAAAVRGDSNFVEESSESIPAFYAFDSLSARGVNFKRYRYTFQAPTNGIDDYIYSVNDVLPGITLYTLDDNATDEGNGTVARVVLA